ncbi:hypothetical protein [Paenibacillus faecalis]|uniref:hypothetical protein n=1 Tax=Paenibacillus faecalis TaxID=2079532 RepID=UPI000D0FF45B|nr:hypothetical protein [Paenibacillus faecalis]
MLALFFACIALLDWFLVKAKPKREKWMMLLVIVLFTAWNICANLLPWWADPFDIIYMAFSWIL